MSRQCKGALMAAGGGICWGISGTMGQYLFTHEAMHTTWLIPIRLSLAGLLLFAYWLVKDRKLLFAPWRQRGSARLYLCPRQVRGAAPYCCLTCCSVCLRLRGSGSDIQIVGEAMKRYAASKDKNIHRLMQYADQLRVKPKVLRYMEVLL